MSKALAIKYRPKSWEDLTEQSYIKQILENQIKTNTIKHGYLFCGGAGTGKTTSARIFADLINDGKGVPIELDAASNNSVEDVRKLIEQAQTIPLQGKYKVLIVDECHSISNQGFQALLKTLEEPPATAVFILCTTNPEKIPATILSRVQRYNFQRISYEGIVKRLNYILEKEGITDVQGGCVDIIAKTVDGGMRDGITLLDKCLSYNSKLTLETVTSILGIIGYETMLDIIVDISELNKQGLIIKLDEIHHSGLDLKQFVKSLFEFTLGFVEGKILKDISRCGVPNSSETKLKSVYSNPKVNAMCEAIVLMLGDLMVRIKYEHNPKPIIMSEFLRFMRSYNDWAE